MARYGTIQWTFLAIANPVQDVTECFWNQPCSTVQQTLYKSFRNCVDVTSICVCVCHLHSLGMHPHLRDKLSSATLVYQNLLNLRRSNNTTLLSYMGPGFHKWATPIAGWFIMGKNPNLKSMI